ncbi:MAG: hypothetical protein LBU87_05080 [Lactobacillales bacterium]|jgi:hypothetical protein|nr:hypothetical protein [Lactobacillales bacterium]
MTPFALGLSHEELLKRTDPKHLTVKKMLDIDAVGYKNLKDGDKKALVHLLHAAYIIEEINYYLDNPFNIPFRDFLDTEIKKGNDDARLTKILFDGHKGIFGVDTQAQPVVLAKGVCDPVGKGFYPADLTPEKFHTILIRMLNDEKINEVRDILNGRSIVVYEGEDLCAIDIVDYFKKDFEIIATELRRAAETSTNEAFTKYLMLQADALETADPMLDALADKQWASLQDTPLEFTITRENYEDNLTASVLENDTLKALLDKHGITPITKDQLGGRVGIVNKKGTDFLLKGASYVSIMAENMPFKDEYSQSFENTGLQTMVDADLVELTGDTAAYRGSIVTAENLPNDDKLSLTIGGGRRNVYHRQIRMSASPQALKERQALLDAVLAPEQHALYSDEAMHCFVIGHENAHSLGPSGGTEKLGKYQSAFEEYKADVTSIAMLDILTQKGLYTRDERDKIIVSYVTQLPRKAKSGVTNAHRTADVMEINRFMEEGALNVTPDGRLKVDLDKFVPAAQKILQEIIRMQLDGDIKQAEAYLQRNFVWTPLMNKLADKMKQANQTLNGRVESPLANALIGGRNK